MPFAIDQIAETSLYADTLAGVPARANRALNEEAITTCIGDVAGVLAKGTPHKAFLVQAKRAPSGDDRLQSGGWKGAAIFHHQMQV